MSHLARRYTMSKNTYTRILKHYGHVVCHKCRLAIQVGHEVVSKVFRERTGYPQIYHRNCAELVHII